MDRDLDAFIRQPINENLRFGLEDGLGGGQIATELGDLVLAPA